jgi:hypothetical protein
MAIRSYLKRHGLKLKYVANGMGMDESLLRYHLARGLDDPGLVERFKALMREHARGVLADLDEVQPPDDGTTP